jgi:hypothetical protein
MRCGEKDRNCVFQGSKYPDPQHLQKLNAVFPSYERPARLNSLASTESRERPIGQVKHNSSGTTSLSGRLRTQKLSLLKIFPGKHCKKNTRIVKMVGRGSLSRVRYSRLSISNVMPKNGSGNPLVGDIARPYR